MATANGIIKVIEPSYYTAKDISTFLGCSVNNAYKRIAGLRKEFADRGYSLNCVKAGTIPKWFFHERSGI